MGAHVILMRFDTAKGGADPATLHARAVAALKAARPGLFWRDSFAATGRYHAIDIVELPEDFGPKAASAVIEGLGYAQHRVIATTLAPWLRDGLTETADGPPPAAA